MSLLLAATEHCSMRVGSLWVLDDAAGTAGAVQRAYLSDEEHDDFGRLRALGRQLLGSRLFKALQDCPRSTSYGLFMPGRVFHALFPDPGINFGNLHHFGIILSAEYAVQELKHASLALFPRLRVLHAMLEVKEAEPLLPAAFRGMVALGGFSTTCGLDLRASLTLEAAHALEGAAFCEIDVYEVSPSEKIEVANFVYHSVDARFYNYEDDVVQEDSE